MSFTCALDSSTPGTFTVSGSTITICGHLYVVEITEKEGRFLVNGHTLEGLARNHVYAVFPEGTAQFIK